MKYIYNPIPDGEYEKMISSLDDENEESRNATMICHSDEVVKEVRTRISGSDIKFSKSGKLRKFKGCRAKMNESSLMESSLESSITRKEDSENLEIQSFDHLASSPAGSFSRVQSDHRAKNHVSENQLVEEVRRNYLEEIEQELEVSSMDRLNLRDGAKRDVSSGNHVSLVGWFSVLFVLLSFSCLFYYQSQGSPEIAFASNMSTAEVASKLFLSYTEFEKGGYTEQQMNRDLEVLRADHLKKNKNMKSSTKYKPTGADVGVGSYR